MKKFWMIVGLISSISLVAYAGEKQISFEKHLIAANKEICKNLDGCQPGRGDFQSCWEELNKYSRGNKENKKIQVFQGRSEECLAFLKTTDCKADIVKLSTEKKCALSALQKE